MKTDLYWGISICGFLVIAVVAGGSSLPDRAQFLTHAWLSLVLLCGGLWRLRYITLDSTSKFSLAVLAAGFCLMFLQLLPLPQTVWSVMGGREFVVESMSLIGQSNAWIALSLSPEATRLDILAFLPGAAVFIAMLSVGREQHALIGLTLVGLALGALVLSLVAGAARGGFANPNFFAAQLYMTIPFVLALASRSSKKAIWICAACAVALCMAGIAQSGSRLGLVTGFGVLLVSCLSLLPMGRKPEVYGLALLALTITLVLLFGGAGLERFAGLQTAFAARAELFTTSLQAMIGFLPAGSGFGSFVPVYQIYEAPASISPSYVNHAHNDWLELVLEGGLLMAAVVVAFLRLYTHTLLAVWNGHSAFGKAAGISTIAVMLHSLADYPLRTPALLVLFSCCCGLMVRSAVHAQRQTWNFSAGRALPA